MKKPASALVVALVFVAACKNDPPPVEAVHPNAPSAVAPPASAPPPAAPPVASASAPPSLACRSDEDCILTTFPGCCSCCECGPLHATTKEVDKSDRDACSGKKCPSCDNLDYKCVPCKDPAKEGMRARCNDSRCILVETKAAAPAEPPPIACKTDDDCWFDDANKPVPRPTKFKGRKIIPCKTGEHVPACNNAVCIVRAYKC